MRLRAHRALPPRMHAPTTFKRREEKDNIRNNIIGYRGEGINLINYSVHTFAGEGCRPPSPRPVPLPAGQSTAELLPSSSRLDRRRCMSQWNFVSTQAKSQDWREAPLLGHLPWHGIL